MFDHIAAALEEIDGALDRLDANGLVGPQPAAALEALTRHERAVAAARLALTERAAQMHQWERLGYRSFEEWLAATQGTSQGRARQRARTARKIKDRPKTARALAEGDISEDEADVVADAADKNPDAEDDLLGTAKNKGRTHKDLRDRAAKAKAAAEDDRARARRLRRDRTARWCRDRDGHWALHAKLEPHIGAAAQSQLQARLDRIFAAHRRTGDHEPRDRYAADALAELLAERPESESDDYDRGDQPTPTPAARPHGPAAPSKEIVVIIDLAAYRRGAVDPSETCEIRNVGPVPVSVAHQWAHDAFIKAVITDGTDIRTVTHLGRHRPALLDTALQFRDPECVVPGCDSSFREWDHRITHADDGPTSLENLRGLCPAHHRQRTHQGHELSGQPGHRQWIDPDDRTLAADDPADLPAEARAP